MKKHLLPASFQCQTPPPMDFSILGNSIITLPRKNWSKNMFFMGIDDDELRGVTGDRFPATLRKDKTTHPIFILQAYSTGNIICPCSSMGNKRSRGRYIEKGCRLKKSNHEMDADSFLIEQFSFTLPLDVRFSKKLTFKGVVPETCIKGRRK